MTTKQILQLNAFPVQLNPETFANARSNSNPNGSLLPLYAFRSMVDSIPHFATCYSPSQRSSENIYGQIVYGASVTEESSFATRVLSDAKTIFEMMTFPNLDGSPGVWRPVYSFPEDWHDISQSGKFIDTNLTDFLDQYILLGSPVPLSWRVNDSEPQNLSPRTIIESIQFKFLSVNLIRPWFNSMLFSIGGWVLSGQAKGFCSSGRLDDNKGVFPLLPTGLIICSNIKFAANWDQADIGYLELAESEENKVSLGPFLIEPKRAASSFSLMGFVSTLIPFSPQVEGRKSTLQWTGKTMSEIDNSLSNLFPASILIKIENHTDVEMRKLRDDRRSGLFEDKPQAVLPARSAQGFSTYLSIADGGPEGWLVYSFANQFNLVIYWRNLLTRANAGCISFIPSDLALSRDNLSRFCQSDSAISSFDSYHCDATIGDGFVKANFNYVIFTI
jgi:hypothetical protein